MTRLLIAVLVFASGCTGTTRVTAVRFANEPIVWQVNDRTHTPKPRAQKYMRELYFADALIFRRLFDLLRVRVRMRAVDVNALGEVPDSTWFVNRIGTRPLTPAQVATGPNEYATPSLATPWKIKSMKVGGTAPGFIIKDGRGHTYLIKFDEPKYPEVDTATHLVAQRLLWAAGYGVPHDSIVRVPASQFVIRTGTKIKAGGRKRLMRRSDLLRTLAKADRRADGTYRVLASRYLSGVPLGGMPTTGTRSDDPNDSIPHQHRRSVRGMYVLFSWLDHIDVKPDNTLDMWVTDADGKTHYVMHYLVDFGKAFGSMSRVNNRDASGHAYNLDWGYIFQSLPAFGLWRRPWERGTFPRLRGVGDFIATGFQPGDWRPVAPYAPFQARDRYDVYWGAKIVMAFTRAHVAAAVAQGKYSDPRSARYVVDTLMKRRRMIGSYAFRRVNPLDRFEVVGGRLCFSDLLLRYNLASAAERRGTRYAATILDHAGRALAYEATARPDRRGGACFSGYPSGSDHDGYTIVRVVTSRGRKHHKAVDIHIARREGTLHIVGVHRH